MLSQREKTASAVGQLEVIVREPDGPPTGPPVLFVHGGYHAAWCWEEHFLGHLAERGYSAVALSLRGHGESPGYAQLDSAGLDDYVQDVLGVLEELPESPVLVGHSLGGAVVQRLMAAHEGRLRGAVLMSSPPPSGMSTWSALRWLRSGMRPLRQLGALHRGKLQPERDGFPYGCFFAGDLPAEDRARYAARMQKESRRVGRELTRRLVRRGGPPRIPLMVMGGAEDWFFPPDVLARTAAAYDLVPQVTPGVGHDMMLDAGWQDAAETLLGFLASLGPRSGGGQVDDP